MTGFANVRGDSDRSPMISWESPPATCICDPDRFVFCDEAGRLTLLIRRGERIVSQYGDRIPLNIAVDELADHLRVDRTSVLTAISLRGKSAVRSQTRVP